MILTGENIVFINMIFSNLGDFLTAGNHRLLIYLLLYGYTYTRNIILECKQLVTLYQHKSSGINQITLLVNQLNYSLKSLGYAY